MMWLLTPSGNALPSGRVGQLILHAAQRQPFGIRTEVEDREQAPVDGLPDGQVFVFDDGIDKVVVIEIAARAVPPEEGQRLKIGQRMVEAMAAGCAVEIELRTAAREPFSDGEHAVGVVLFPQGRGRLARSPAEAWSRNRR